MLTDMGQHWVRAVVPIVYVAFVALGATTNDRPLTSVMMLTVGAAVVGGSLVWREPGDWLLAGGLGVAAGLVLIACHGDPANLGWFAMCILAGWAAYRTGLVPTVVMGGGLVTAIVVEWFLATHEPGWGAWIAGTVFTVVASRVARRQHALAERLRAAQADLEDSARIEERARIAGEMHDVIGHALTVSLMHVSSARLALDDDPVEARASLLEAEKLARASLDEVRSAVSMLRETGGGLAPLPSVDDVDALVASFRRAGAEVELELKGDADALGASRGLAVYRIVQESLTNAVRHGDGSTVRVCVAVGPEKTVVTTVNGRSHRHETGEGTGVLGMRERAEAFGGTLQSGSDGEGWRVEAVLPS